MSQKLQPFPGNISFNAQHSPMGAFMSFTCGNFGTRGGVGLQIGQPGNQDVYIGVKDGDRRSDAPPRCLPFYQGKSGEGASAFLVEQAGPEQQNVPDKVQAYRAEQIRRFYGWATDRWQTDELEFCLHTPFGGIPDPQIATPEHLRDALLPAITGRLTLDNRKGQGTKTAFFALHFHEPGARPLDLGSSARFRLAFAHRRDFGVAAELREAGTGAIAGGKPFLFQQWTVDGGLRDVNPVHMLASAVGIGFEVPAGKSYELVIAIGCYLDRVVTTGLEGKYLYGHYFGSLGEVLAEALDRADELRAAAEARDEELLASGLTADQQFIIAHATRSYYGSTQLLEVGGEPFFIVNEGEYCMMNTLDLSVDHMFWELKQNPWAVRNLLDNFVRHYSYIDEVKRDRSGNSRHAPGGISFTHDMGVHNNFSPPGTSSYELENLTGCFSYMTAEQLCNWSLLAATYVLKTGDLPWARLNQHVLAACVSSLVNRGGETGYVHYDSSRCDKGAEITTYDSLDNSLAQTRNNVYMAVKCWASYLGLALVLEQLQVPSAKTARDEMGRIEQDLQRRVNAEGVFPAVFEADNPGYVSRILPACEGLIYPLVWGVRERSPLQDVLKQHTRVLLLDPQRRNLFADGGLKLSSTSNNSWMSKICLVMHVARRVFGLDQDEKVKQLFAAADAAHVKWQTDGSGYWACSDQLVSGKAHGSRFYPRIITSALWLEP
ncbi:MAG TPA: glycoside hydrolase family 52 protein [Candidatus Acidoferrum sp.]|nr:glycoside hydrolase family 52 protein [Candidatus Acidoferrum sp.]